MFENLDWKWALRRAAIVVAIYLVLMYVLSTVAPETFGLQSAAEWVPILVNAVLFFFVFTFVYAFIERSRRRRMYGNPSGKPKEKSEADEERESGPLKGKPNPNQSKRKATRRRK